MKIYYKALDLRINLKSKQFLVPEFIWASLMLNTVGGFKKSDLLKCHGFCT